MSSYRGKTLRAVLHGHNMKATENNALHEEYLNEFYSNHSHLIRIILSGIS